MGLTTVANIIPEVCNTIWDELSPIHITFPQTPEEWLLIAENFKYKWNFPLCVGAVDSKHVFVKTPGNTVSLKHNSKCTFSVIMMVVEDANLQFIAIIVGAYGCNSDGGVFSNCNIGKAISRNTLNLPADKILPTVEHLEPLPYVLLEIKHFHKDIVDLFSDEYNTLYNYVPFDNDDMLRIRSTIDNILQNTRCSGYVITLTDVRIAVDHLKSDKENSFEGLRSDHFINGDNRL